MRCIAIPCMLPSTSLHAHMPACMLLSLLVHHSEGVYVCVCVYRRVRTLSGRSVTVETVSATLAQRKNASEGLPTKTVNALQRALVREAVRGSLVDIHHCVQALAFQAGLTLLPTEDKPNTTTTSTVAITCSSAQAAECSTANGEQGQPCVVLGPSSMGHWVFGIPIETAQGEGGAGAEQSSGAADAQAPPARTWLGPAVLGTGAEQQGSALARPDAAVLSRVYDALTIGVQSKLALPCALPVVLWWGACADVGQCQRVRSHVKQTEPSVQSAG